ncbi:MAG: alpha/beta hydrolase [Pirellulaceae bacterium]|nr:alpha/beta hydrolase [Pirellulaceae bacterium]
MSARTQTHETSMIDVAGKKTQVTIGGSGPPLLYLHSAGGETEWTAFHQMLSEHFTVYLPAHPGFALSSGLDQVRDVTDYAWHYVDLLAQLGLPRVPVVGFSLGAWTGMELAILRPALVERLLLVNSAGLHLPGAPVAELFIDDLDELRRLLFFDPESPAVAEAMPSSLDDPRILLWVRAREATARVGWNPYLHNPRLPDHLRRIECPVRILWGREDRLLPLAHGQYLAEQIPRAELRVFEQCGHMLPFEKPAEFVAEVRRFLTSP